ncbi:MAG: YggS family pyridoxal phosphate-dependent enzyme [Rhodoglobus sp.]|nr:YggS family pyridoxal phosphate-dependent enzyme [Rhodoglobus sp.]
MADLEDRFAAVTEQIADAARSAGREPGEITTIVVTKFHPAAMVRELASLGVRDFGESRHQEAQPKIASLEDVAAVWHFVGQIQSKKAKLVRDYVDVVHAVDRPGLVDALARDSAPRELDVFIQINLTDDPDRGGATLSEVGSLADLVTAAQGLRLRGLMAVAPLHSEPRREFARVRELSERLTKAHPEASALSMGMSGDFREAIAEGATHLRIGTAITGNRPIPG